MLRLMGKQNKENHWRRQYKKFHIKVIFIFPLLGKYKVKFTMYLFIYSLCNNTASNSDYILSYYRMIMNWKECGSGCGLV
jgi:hypothetical protein